MPGTVVSKNIADQRNSELKALTIYFILMIIEKSKLAHGLELARQIENLPLAVKSDLSELLLLDVQLLFSHRSPDC